MAVNKATKEYENYKVLLKQEERLNSIKELDKDLKQLMMTEIKN